MLSMVTCPLQGCSFMVEDNRRVLVSGGKQVQGASEGNVIHSGRRRPKLMRDP
jgi:hypothetical protein